MLCNHQLLFISFSALITQLVYLYAMKGFLGLSNIKSSNELYTNSRTNSYIVITAALITEHSTLSTYVKTVLKPLFLVSVSVYGFFLTT
jgi:hypothetical protein